MGPSEGRCQVWACRLVAGSKLLLLLLNTSTVTLRVVGGDEKGSLKSETVKYGPSPKGLGPEKGYLARTSGIYKRQTRPLVREGSSQKQNCNCRRVINIWSGAPDGARRQDLLTDWPSVAMWLWLWLWLWAWRGGGEAGSSTSTVALRVVEGDKKGSLKTETVKHGREFHGTRTREWLRWRGPAAILNDRPVLSSERAPYINKFGTGRLTGGRNIWLDSNGLGAKTNWLAVNRQS
jgi:hypothetical protein